MAGFENDRQDETPAASTGGPSDLETVHGSGPLWYLGEAIRIARFDSEAIARASQDRRALFYGAGFLAAGFLAGRVIGLLLSEPTPDAGPVPNWILSVLVTVVAVPVGVLFSAVNVAVVHGAAKVLFDATGRYVALLRVLWLGSIVQWLNVIPLVGALVGSVWFLLITLVTFEEVDGVERLQALALVVGFAVLMLFVSMFIS
jgi:hypothetical protein